MKQLRIVLYFVLFGLFVAGAWWYADNLDSPRVLGRTDHGDGSHSVDILSPAYKLDRVYKSMRGPHSNQPRLRLAEQLGHDEILWLTGVETSLVEAESLEPISNEYFCHANLTFNPDTTSPEEHNDAFESPTHVDWRLFTLIPGRLRIELPLGFGLPIKNGTLVDYYTMALNQNPSEAIADPKK